MNRFTFSVAVVVCGLCSCKTDEPATRPEQTDTVRGDTVAAPTQLGAVPILPDDMYGIIILWRDTLVVAEIDTTTRASGVPDIGFWLSSLDEDSLAVVSASGHGSLKFLQGRLLASARESLTRPQDGCRFFPLIEAEVMGEQDSAVFVRRGSLRVAGSRVLSPQDSLYRQLESVARDYERERDVFRNKVVAQRAAKVERIVVLESSEASYATVTLSRVDDNLETGGHQDFTAILRKRRSGHQFVADGDIHSEGDGEGKGHEFLRVLFITTDAANRPVLITEADYWGGSGGYFFVRLAEGQWSQFGVWGSGC